MKKITVHTESSAKQYAAYVVGFVLSIILTLISYYMVVRAILPKTALIYTVLAIAVVQLVVQMVFFLHIGRGSRWKLLAFIFTVLVVGIVVVGTIWIMDNLNYNMMHMTPAEQQHYMNEHEGI